MTVFCKKPTQSLRVILKHMNLIGCKKEQHLPLKVHYGHVGTFATFIRVLFVATTNRKKLYITADLDDAIAMDIAVTKPKLILEKYPKITRQKCTRYIRSRKGS